MTGILAFVANTLAWSLIIGGYAAFAWEMSYEPPHAVLFEVEGDQ